MLYLPFKCCLHPKTAKSSTQQRPLVVNHIDFDLAT